MARLIDADALIDFLDVGHLRHPSELCFSEIDVANLLLHAPTISLDEVRGVVHCKDCEWWTKQEASIQGRCARLAIYPTGEFYCASGSKREPPKGVE